jgi:hypothetical protein
LQPGHATKRPASAGPTRRDFAQFEHCTRIMDFASGRCVPPCTTVESGSTKSQPSCLPP